MFDGSMLDGIMTFLLGVIAILGPIIGFSIRWSNDLSTLKVKVSELEANQKILKNEFDLLEKTIKDEVRLLVKEVSDTRVVVSDAMGYIRAAMEVINNKLNSEKQSK